MAPDEGCRQAEFVAKGAHFVLEKFAQRFDQFQPHFFGQSAHVVVRFDRDRRAAGKRHAFDDIGVKCALGQEFCAFDPVGVFLKDVDEQPADDLAFGFGVAHAVKFAKEQVGLVRVDQRNVVIVAKHRDDLVGLVLAQQPVINKDASQVVANRLVDQNGGDRAVNAARQPTDHLGVAHLFADQADRFLSVG